MEALRYGRQKTIGSLDFARAVAGGFRGESRWQVGFLTMFGQQLSEDRNAVSIQRWDVAKDVFRFTLGEALPAGEYAFAQILPDGINLYVWDFGVDRKSSSGSKKEN